MNFLHQKTHYTTTQISAMNFSHLVVIHWCTSSAPTFPDFSASFPFYFILISTHQFIAVQYKNYICLLHSYSPKILFTYIFSLVTYLALKKKYIFFDKISVKWWIRSIKWRVSIYQRLQQDRSFSEDPQKNKSQKFNCLKSEF